MGALEIVLGIVIMVFAVTLIFMVLMQSGKDKRLSGSIAGGAETFFGKSKGKTTDKLLSRLTTVLAFVFGIIAVAMYIMISTKYGA
ncbi:MAG: preprotein translocase subunit SecG [Clostridia bacterium]|nr:preprotein translocase subunit SecG [Clostridia bacterium]